MEYHASFESNSVLDASNLERGSILAAMLEHISDYQRQDTTVDLTTLKSSVISQVIDALDPEKPLINFHEETQLRGFLRAFENTAEYSSQLKILDERTQAQIRVFKDKLGEWKDDNVWQDLQENGFQLPGINPQVSNNVTSTTSHRNLLSSAKDLLIDIFVNLARPLILLFLRLRMREAARRLERQQAQKYARGPRIYEQKDEKNSKPMDVYTNLPFRNWGRSIQNIPRYTFVPKTVLGVKNLILFAKEKNFRVRCGGYRHSWSNTFSQDKEILISLLPIVQVTMLPDPISIYPASHNVEPTELNQIELVSPPSDQSNDKIWCRVGASVTNEDFRRWAIKNGKWSLPVDVILVEVTIGGVNGPICHGAGIHHATINDYVREVQYVDANGIHQTVIDPIHLKAAAGCFGLLGIVTHITFALDEMSYAVLKTLKVPVAQAIPPLQKEQIPAALRIRESGDKTYEDITNDDLESWKKDFARRAAEDYYSEWFWFTYQKRVWVNTWNNTADPFDAIEYPNAEETFFQWLQGWLGGIMSANHLFQALPGAWQAQMLATLGMAVLPPTNGEDKRPTMKTLLPDALHFRRGVQNMRVRDMEFQIPIPDLPDSDEPDWSVVQRAWWDAINLVYEMANHSTSPPPSGFRERISRAFRHKLPQHGKTPMRLTLELRIMGDSKIHMAPQAGNKRTASIEVLTVPDAQHDSEWLDFMQRLSDKWMSYTDSNNVRLNVRPHWAKEWDGLKMGPEGKQVDAREYLREVSYRSAIENFKGTLEEIGKLQGWGLKDLKARFSNELWDEIVFF